MPAHPNAAAHPAFAAITPRRSPAARRSLTPVALLAAALLTATFAPALAQSAAPGSDPRALAAVRAAVAAELHADQTDKSIWRYRDHDVTPDKDGLYDSVETREGELRRLIELSGHPLTPAQNAAEIARIQLYVTDAAAQTRRRKNGQHDDDQAREILRMLPDAFVWKITADTPEYLTLTYEPNPAFTPPDMEARVMSTMAGQMIIAADGNRIRTLHGALSDDVRIGFGILGKLNRGGTFDIERRELAPHIWQITETHVHIGGHALLFKTIGQQEDEVKTDWKPSPANTFADAARLLGVNP